MYSTTSLMIPQQCQPMTGVAQVSTGPHCCAVVKVSLADLFGMLVPLFR
jgi:hypothetical protein